MKPADRVHQQGAHMMSHLAKLTITQVKRQSALSPQEARRTKLITKLEEQLKLAEALGCVDKPDP
jgi:hypothetical protein